MGRESRCPMCGLFDIADPFGDHHVGCGGNGDRIHRHDSIRDVLFTAAQSAALAPRKEVPSLIPGTSNRPADIYLASGCTRRDSDFHSPVANGFQSFHLSRPRSENW